MFSTGDIETLRNGKLLDSNGDKIGNVGEIFLDDRTGQPAWATVNTSLFGTSESFVPLDGATRQGEDLQVRFDKATVKDSPRVGADDEHLDVEQEKELYRYYGLDHDGQDGSGQDGEDQDRPGQDGDDHDHDHDRSSDDDASDAQLSGSRVGDVVDGDASDPAGGSGEQAGRRLRRYVVTEETREVNREQLEEQTPDHRDIGGELGGDRRAARGDTRSDQGGVDHRPQG